MLSPSYIILRIQRLESRANSGDLDNNEPPHQDLRFLQVQLISSLVVKKELRTGSSTNQFSVHIFKHFFPVQKYPL